MNGEKLSKIDAALIIGIITILGYGTAYCYQYGYQSYYKLPPSFIDLSINTLAKPLFFTSITLQLVITAVDILFRKRRIIMTIKGLIKKSILFTICIIGLAVLTSNFLGLGEASIKHSYLVVKQKEGLYVEVIPYKDGMIIAPLNQQTQKMEPKFRYIETKDLKDTEMVNFEHGLKVKSIRNSNELK
jgi:hypothetical protein